MADFMEIQELITSINSKISRYYLLIAKKIEPNLKTQNFDGSVKYKADANSG